MARGAVPVDLTWVLRNARECAVDHDVRRRAGLARALAVHRSQVGRWEQGRYGLHEHVVVGYERALGLAPDTLTCALDVLSRDAAPIRALPTVQIERPADVPTLVLPYLERALAGEALTGSEWTRLAGLLATCTDVVMRRDDWCTLVGRPLLEMAVTHGLENSLRWEASARLVAHPRCHGVAAELAAEALDNPEQQLFADYTALLQYSPDPAGLGVLLDHLTPDLSDDRMWAILLSLATFARRPASRDRINSATPRLLELLLDTTRSARVRRAAAGVLGIADPHATDRLAAALSGRAADAARLLHQGSTSTITQQRDLLREVTTALTNQELPAHDPVFRRILHQATYEADEDSRGNALAVLVLSAQGPVIGRVHGRRLSAAVATGDQDQAAEHLAALCWLAQPSDLDLLTQLATASGPLARLSAYALGNCIEKPGPQREARDGGLLAAARAGTGSPHGLTYALALRGRFDLLTRLERDSRRKARGEWARCSRWWLSLPGSIRDLARQHSQADPIGGRTLNPRYDPNGQEVSVGTK